MHNPSQCCYEVITSITPVTVNWMREQEWVYYGQLTDQEDEYGRDGLALVHWLTGALPRFNDRIVPPPEAEQDIPRQARGQELRQMS